jgi:hypothetical protein
MVSVFQRKKFKNESDRLTGTTQRFISESSAVKSGKTRSQGKNTMTSADYAFVIEN